MKRNRMNTASRCWRSRRPAGAELRHQPPDQRAVPHQPGHPRLLPGADPPVRRVLCVHAAKGEATGVSLNKRRIGTHGAYRCMAARDMPRFFLAFSRILCYSVVGATSTPVGGSPRSFSGVIYSLLPPYRKGAVRRAANLINDCRWQSHLYL